MTTSMSRFATFVDSQQARSVELPLVHSTRSEILHAIASTGVLEPQSCSVFGEKLTYLFYGRPVYRSSRFGLEPSTDLPYCPICLVFRPDAIRNIARLYPCDSGGLRGDKFDPPIPGVDYLHFELSRTLKSARRLTSKFFGTNRNYYHGAAKKNLPLPKGEVEAHKYYELITTSGTSAFDQRRSAIEAQTHERIELRNNIAFVILPTAFLGIKKVRNLIAKEWRAELITYPTYEGGIPVEYTTTIVERLREQFERGGYFSP